MDKKEEKKLALLEQLPKDEVVFVDGIVLTYALISGKWRVIRYNYALTDKAMYTLSSRFLWIKPKLSRLPYSDVDSFIKKNVRGYQGFMFFMKSGPRPNNTVVFDQYDKVLNVLLANINMAEDRVNK